VLKSFVKLNHNELLEVIDISQIQGHLLKLGILEVCSILEL